MTVLLGYIQVVGEAHFLKVFNIDFYQYIQYIKDDFLYKKKDEKKEKRMITKS